MQRSSFMAFVSGFIILLILIAGCPSQSPESAKVIQEPTTIPTKVPTPTPEKEIVYVYITVTVTPEPTTPEPTLTKDPVALTDLPSYTAWRYQSTSKTDSGLQYGPVSALMLHIEKAPTENEYTLYYEYGRRWREELERLIENVRISAPAVRSSRLRSAIGNFAMNLTIQNQSIRTLDRVMTNWQFAEAGKVTRGIVLNITNATAALDREVAYLI